MLEIIGAVAAFAATATIPAGHKRGDVLLGFAYRDGSSTSPSTPAGWTLLAGAGGGTQAHKVCMKVATSGSETSGTWTNASALMIVVVRGCDVDNPLGGNGNSTGTSTTVGYPAVTLSDSGHSLVVAFAGHQSVDTALETPPTGFTNLLTAVNATCEVACHYTNNPRANVPAENVSVGGTSAQWRTWSTQFRPAKYKINNFQHSSAIGADGISVTEKTFTK